MSSDTATGRILDGKYRLGPLIGRGAVGRVYRATQICLDREVAIKILHPGYANHPEAIARFRQEACAASRLSHPGIVTVFDWGQEDGLFYLAIEYLPGTDLFDIAQKQAPLASDRVARLMEQVARALAHAHSQGVIHRDLKPENLRVVKDPHVLGEPREIVKIYDFGIAHVAQNQAGMTQAGTLIGTPYYMSPEQAAAAAVTPASDLYSCGVIMYLLTTGRLPFVATSPIEVASMHIREPPPAPSRANPLLDPRLERIILQCLAKRPADRPRSGVELAAMLLPLAEISTEPHPARRAGAVPSSRPTRSGASLSWTAAWAIGATSALGALVAGQWMPAIRGDTRTDTRAGEELLSHSLRSAAPQATDARRLYSAAPASFEQPSPLGSSASPSTALHSWYKRPLF